MSRDAKVGLVIVFAFVFLLGTILVHRFHLSDLGQLTGGNDAAAVDPNASSPIGDSTSDVNPLGSAESSAVTTVDAHSEENLNTAPGVGRMNSPFDPNFSGSQRFTGQATTTRPAVDVPDSSDSGAHISLSDPRDDQPGAAVAESGRIPMNLGRNEPFTGQTSGTEMPEARPDSHQQSPLLLEISKGSSGVGSTAREIPDTETAISPTAGDVSSMDSKEPATDLPAEVTDATQSEPESMADTRPGRRIPPLNRPPSLEPDDDPAEMETGPTSIQQAEDKRRSEREDNSPPKLPKYGEQPQATIESVPDRDSRTPPRAADRSTGTAEPFSPPNRTPLRSSQSDDHEVAGQKTYVVKEGDSFWSISARQYGTGKYFRALEEYNKDRLSTSGSGGKVLRPGTVLALPDESLLQSSSTRKKPAEPAAATPGKYDSWKEDSSIETPPRRDSGLAPKREAALRPGTYRVKEGDTLSTIALRELGTSKRWQEIFQLNRNQLRDEQSLKVGMELKMPPTSTAEKAAGRPNF